jgi:protein tyrosine/serine phosphatase
MKQNQIISNDAQAVNFREIRIGSIAPGKLYRAGVDRTGFFSMVLESFMGATVDEIVNDYLLSFNSIFDSSIYGEVNTNDSQVAMQLLSAISGSEAIDDNNLQVVAENYFRNVIRLSAKNVELLRNQLATSLR